MFQPFWEYKNLTDFYVGSTIFSNYNKIWDILIFFVYSMLFFVVYYVSNLDFKVQLPDALGKIYNKFKILFENVCFLVCKHSKVICLIILFISSCLFYKNIFNIDSTIFTDYHHYGEKFATYFAHEKFNMQYYKDIMLVHGLLDVLPSQLGNFIFGELTVFSEQVAGQIIKYLFFVINLVLGINIFKKNYFFVVCINLLMILYNLPLHIMTMVLVFINLVITSENDKKPVSVFWFLAYLMSCFFFVSYHTTFGMMFLISSLPLFIKKLNKHKLIGILVLLIFCISIFLLFKAEIVGFLVNIKYYSESNLYSFGNFFPERINIYKLLFSLFAFVSFPIFVIYVFYTKEKDNKILSIFTILFTLSILSYALGRVDSSDVILRSIDWSLVVLLVILPYLFYTKDLNKFKIYNTVVIIALHILYLTSVDDFSFLMKKGFSPENLQNLKALVNNNCPLNSTVLDLNNAGMNYYYMDRKPAIPYVSFYNIVNTKQANDVLSNLRQQSPACILIYDSEKSALHDDISFTLRVNPIYRWIYLSNQYNFIEENGYILATKTRKNNLKHYEGFMINNLKHLPDVWGASIDTLPMNAVNVDFYTPQNADLLSFEYEVLENPNSDVDIDFYVTYSESESFLLFTSKKRKVLIPLDYFPSWLFVKDLSTIKIYSNQPISIKSQKFYKRNE